MTAPERRRAPRAAEKLSLAIRGAGDALQAETTNLSATGLYCRLGRFLAPMTKLQLELEVPGDGRASRIRADGVVVRVDPVVVAGQQPAYHTAVFFTELADRDRRTIAQFVERRLSAGTATPTSSCGGS